jgi:hypothetical protein
MAGYEPLHRHKRWTIARCCTVLYQCHLRAYRRHLWKTPVPRILCLFWSTRLASEVTRSHSPWVLRVGGTWRTEPTDKRYELENSHNKSGSSLTAKGTIMESSERQYILFETCIIERAVRWRTFWPVTSTEINVRWYYLTTDVFLQCCIVPQ